jgi:hypothetical protein
MRALILFAGTIALIASRRRSTTKKFPPRERLINVGPGDRFELPGVRG